MRACARPHKLRRRPNEAGGDKPSKVRAVLHATLRPFVRYSVSRERDPPHPSDATAVVCAVVLVVLSPL
eukprot:3236223-Prymnesium_polylepis.2